MLRSTQQVPGGPVRPARKVFDAWALFHYTRAAPGEDRGCILSDLLAQRIYTTAALLLLAFLLATNIYRAGHQSIVIDEAFTYPRHIAVSRFWAFEQYTANNHVLHTVLCK